MGAGLKNIGGVFRNLDKTMAGIDAYVVAIQAVSTTLAVKAGHDLVAQAAHSQSGIELGARVLGGLAVEAGALAFLWKIGNVFGKPSLFNLGENFKRASQLAQAEQPTRFQAVVG